ncbi:MAG: glycine--tRNA ligase [Candidatus Liptonbacteria bacterium]|nr:glycine--tRNA ligase [Candidatus Liptonbacteria bacterium]
MDKIVSLSKRRGFIFPNSEIYGGLANSWDYGPLGVALKNNIKREWWRRFVESRADMVGFDAAIIMNPKVWEATGHVENFSDPLIECKHCHTRFRADDLAGETLDMGSMDFKKWDADKKDDFMEKFPACPTCKAKNEWTWPKMFNLMFKTSIGSTDDAADTAYLRPETAQGMFVNFKNVLQTTRKPLPFGMAQIGKAFRNEITPGNFIFRTREFEQMEIEYFAPPDNWEKQFEIWREEMRWWIKHIGVDYKNIEEFEVPGDERAHYSIKTVDFKYKFPFGASELYGLAYRGDFDLRRHMEKSGEDLNYTDQKTGKKFIPHVIEPSLGVERSVLVAMLEAYNEEQLTTDNSQLTGETKEDDDIRVVMKFPKWLAPIKVAVLPLSKKAELSKVSEKVYKDLLPHFICEYDETQSIGKRYRRQDEIGTPYCVTVDFETLQDKAVTVRDRDTMKQERVKIESLKGYLCKKLK